MPSRPPPGNASRRDFLAAAALASAGTLAGTGCSWTPFVGAPREIIDTHTHFYDPNRVQGVPWPSPDDAILYRPVYPAEFQKLARPHGVTSTVVVEASPWVEDNAWILELAAHDPFLIGLVGHLKPGQPEFAADLNHFTGNRRFRGIRTGGWDIRLAPQDSQYLHDLERLADHALALDVLIGPEQLPQVAALAARLPNLRIIINHCANVRIDGKTPPAEWQAGLEALAGRANVYMKVSGLVEGTGRSDGTAPDDTAFYQPTLDIIWNCFGRDRVIFGSNWPVSARFASYATVFSIVREYFSSHGTEALARYFAGNARIAYRL